MNKWFYAKDGQAIGPLSTPEMHELISQGACTRTTLVWTRGMRDWLPACMATWMWEERAERRTVTTEDNGEPSGDHERIAAADEASVVSRASTPVAADGAQESTTESDDAGVVGMVRKLFGLG